MKRYGKVTVRIGFGLVLCAVLGSEAVFAEVQVLPDTQLMVDGKAIKEHKRLLGHPMVKELLVSVGRAETAVQKEDLDALMAFYAPAYNYHGLKGTDVRRVWGEVFEHYKAVESLHLFSDIKVLQIDSRLRAEVTCTGGLYGTEEQTDHARQLVPRGALPGQRRRRLEVSRQCRRDSGCRSLLVRAASSVILKADLRRSFLVHSRAL